MTLADKLRDAVELARLKMRRSYANINVKDLFVKLDI